MKVLLKSRLPSNIFYSATMVIDKGGSRHGKTVKYYFCHSLAVSFLKILLQLYDILMKHLFGIISPCSKDCDLKRSKYGTLKKYVCC